ncbi:MAG: acyltransferase [Acidobacteriota bacterium]|nr:acyltransferase [Acidobacteriota bacterium]
MVPPHQTPEPSLPPSDDLRAPISKSSPRIPSLDGLRAVSIFLVLALHTLQSYGMTHHVWLIWYGIFDGGTGVLIFFVISGYLITTLLLEEQRKRGSISLRGFYFRRAMRILPPLYTYVGVLLLLGLAGRLVIYKLDILSALFFFHDYALSRMWTLGHFWSLSIEEQFYLLWPFILIYCLRRFGTREEGAQAGRHRAGVVAIAVICLSPVIRVLSFARSSYPFIGDSLHNSYGLHMHADSLMFGCLVALYQGTPQFERVYRAATKIWWLPLAVILFADCINLRLQNLWLLPVGYTLVGASAAIFLLWCVRNPSTLAGRILNARFVMHIGVLSYSIYIWQTIFLHEDSASLWGAAHAYVGTFPGSWLAVLGVASLSFYLIEKPSLRLRNRLITSLRLYAARRQAARATN